MGSQEYYYELKIPKERVAVLIGKKGETKNKIQEATNTRLNIDSKEGDVSITGEDALNLYNAREVVRAIGRGFNPDIALLMLKGDYIFDAFNIEDYASIKTKDSMTRLKGRVIGKDGKSRKTIEQLTECYIVIYGKTIGIIGQAENIANARRAVTDLLRGAPHGNVYKWLEKQKREMTIRELKGKVNR